MPVTNVCVLRAGGEYGPQHVRWLSRMIPDLHCLADAPVLDVPCIPLKHEWPGWWSKMELFRPDIPGDLMFFDLDTVVMGDISKLAGVGRSMALSDFYRPHLLGSGLMYIAEQDKAVVWDKWSSNPAKWMATHRRFPLIGDQGFLNGVFNAGRWQNELPGAVVSYKAHCRGGVPDGAVVVCFHGQPRPWDCGEDWVPCLR